MKEELLETAGARGLVRRPRLLVPLLVVFGIWLTAMGNPLWTMMTADTVQPPTR